MTTLLPERTISPVPLALEASRQGSAAVLTCRGRIVFGTEADDFRTAVLLLLRETDHVILNLAGVTHIDSAGIGSLVGVLISTKNRHGRLSLVSLSDKVRQVLEVAHLGSLFPIFDTAEEAVAAAAAPTRASKPAS